MHEARCALAMIDPAGAERLDPAIVHGAARQHGAADQEVVEQRDAARARNSTRERRSGWCRQTLAKRFFRSQQTTPVVRRGGGLLPALSVADVEPISVMAAPHRSTSATRALYQFMSDRGEQREGQIDQPSSCR